MTFVHPSLLWCLAAVPLLILLSFWRLKAARVVVPSLSLWKKIPERNPPVSSLRGPRFSILLLLQMAAAAAGVLAAAGPALLTDDEAPKTLIVAVDRSASMGTMFDGKRTRMEMAREDLQRKIDGLHKHDRVILISDDEESVSRRLSRGEAIRAAGNLTVTGRAFRTKEVIEWIEILRRSEPRTEVLIVGDKDFPRRPISILPMLWGGDSDNAGIVACEVRETGEGKVDLFLSIFSVPAKEAVVKIVNAEGGERWRGEMPLKPGRNNATFRGIDVGKRAAWSVILDGKDNLPADDVVKVERRGTSALKVLLVGRENPFVEKALKAASPGTVVHQSPSGEPAPGYDIYIYDGVEPRLPAEGSVVVIDPSGSFDAGPFGRVDVGDLIADSSPLAATADDPLTKHVDLAGVEVVSPRLISLAGARQVFHAAGKPVALLSEAGGRSMLVLSFRIDRALSWVWKPVGSFAIFWTNYHRYVTNTVKRNDDWRVTDGLLDAEESDNRGTRREAGPLWGGPSGRDVVRRDLTAWLVAFCGMSILASWLLERRMNRISRS